MKHFSFLLGAAVAMAVAVGGGAAHAQLANVKVVTDANPDYSDMESMVHSITSKWPTDKEKMYALFYWDHIARRQTSPMVLHGFELTDPIRQYNDYGFLMCSTITGLKCSVWNYMNYPCRGWNISLHTVPDVWYDGRFHHYDNSLSVHYALEDGVTVAGIPDIGRMGKGPETDGKEVPGYIGMYRCLNGTGPNGYLEGGDNERDLKHLAQDSFRPNFLGYGWTAYMHNRGHRYSLNLRDGEVYTRYYSRRDADSPNAVLQVESRPDFKADPAYFTPNFGINQTLSGKDPEAGQPRYRIRGNGERSWTPVLDAANFAGSVHQSENITAGANGLALTDAAKPGFAIFKVEGANVITSLKIKAQATGNASLAISTNNGIRWKQLEGDIKDVKLIEEVSGSYEVLVKVGFEAGGGGTSLQAIDFNTITQVNGKTQPMLKIGKNTVYVGNGEQTGTIFLWPELRGGKYKEHVFEEGNLAFVNDFKAWKGSLYCEENGKEGYMIYKIDAPQDITSFTYGARMYLRLPNCSIQFLHSFDGGKNWIKAYTFTDNSTPWDKIHYETITDVPAGTKSVLLKYSINGPRSGKGNETQCSLYAVHMEVNHKLAAPSKEPVEVTFNWSERQQDYSLVKRSHTQLVDKLPATYTINVGGVDHPVVDSLTVNLKGSRQNVKYGYSDDKDVGGEKWTGVWATYGKNLAAHKPYTVSVKPLPKGEVWGSHDDSGKRLTDTFVGSNYNGGKNYRDGAMWRDPFDITVDLGEAQACKAFRFHLFGFPAQDAIKGEVKDKVEVLTSLDGQNFTSAGNFDFNLRWKDVPENFMWPDDETFKAYNHTLALKDAVNARYVKFKVVPSRGKGAMGTSEVQVLDGYEFKPFDIRIALPDPANNGKAPPNAGVSPNARKWGPDEKLPQTIGKEWKVGGNNVDDIPPQ
ncbi:MAG: discoidin domain-containing protein [Phycisphaerales bacterium]|nr:discoidin domain-containing protein [Phycisphaerales bacterium]